MDPKELRIGNMVWLEISVSPNHDHPLKYIIQPKDFVDIDEGRVMISAIRLTPEILTEWCGFTHQGNIISLKSPIQPRTDRPTYLFYFADHESIRYHRTLHDHIELKYLHQLQNLYFALTEMELEINIPEKV